MKTLLLHVEPDQALAARMGATVMLAERFGAHVMASHVSPPPHVFLPYSESYALPDDISQLLVRHIREVAETVRQNFAAKWPKTGPVWEWLEECGDPAAVLAAQARLADLTIVGLGEACSDDSLFGLTLAGDITLTSGLPVLAVPATGEAPMGDSPVLIAWDGSVQAAHAIRHALPFLKAAPEVLVVEVSEDKAYDLPAADLAPYLARHGVRVEGLRTSPRINVSDELLTAARIGGAELIVMGAYGHTRMREYMLGGVTRDLLRKAEIPLLLCH